MNALRTAAGALQRPVHDAGYVVDLLLRTIGAVGFLPRRLRFTLDMAYGAGVRAFPVTMVVSVFTGAILALQAGIELQRIGSENLIGSVTALSMCREMGPFITGLILAATVGSSMAAELGTMKVSEEIDALEVMSVDPVNYLVLPRLVALAIMCPLLTVFSNFMGIVGGSILSAQNLGVSSELYWNTVQTALTDNTNFLPKDVYAGLFKSFVFGIVIAIMGCSAGLRASGGALGVGLAVQAAVRNSVILIIILGYVITWAFYFLAVG